MTEQSRLEDFLPVKELREVLGVSTDTIARWQRRGLPSYRVGRRRWFDQFEVARFIKEKLQIED